MSERRIAKMGLTTRSGSSKGLSMSSVFYTMGSTLTYGTAGKLQRYLKYHIDGHNAHIGNGIFGCTSHLATGLTKKAHEDFRSVSKSREEPTKSHDVTTSRPHGLTRSRAHDLTASRAHALTNSRTHELNEITNSMNLNSRMHERA